MSPGYHLRCDVVQEPFRVHGALGVRRQDDWAAVCTVNFNKVFEGGHNIAVGQVPVARRRHGAISRCSERVGDVRAYIMGHNGRVLLHHRILSACETQLE